MIRCLFVAALLLFSSSSFAATKAQAIKIYQNIVKANGFWTYPKLRFSPSLEMNAFMEGRFITINQGMLNRTNVNELALVIGHEIAHYKLWHFRSNHRNEFAADRMGWNYAAKAGYNVCAGKKLFRKIDQVYSKTHPHPQKRYQRLPKC